MRTFPTRRPPRNRLLIFARVPEAGEVKSRLAVDLGMDKALAVYEAMVGDLLDSIGQSVDEDHEIEVLWTGTASVDGPSLRKWFGHRPLSEQAGASLGDRLALAFSERLYFYRAEKVIAIGTDDPCLSAGMIRTAFGLLESCEWVLGPAHDGGYYLIGCRAGAFASNVFRDIEWGTSSVFASTVARIRAGGCTLGVLPRRRDIDLSEDLSAVCDELPQDGRLAGLLREWDWRK